MLKKYEDFDLLLEIIRSINIKIVRYERNLRVHLPYSRYPFKIVQLISFIELETEIDKMKALNRINEIVYTGRKNILQYRTGLHYARLHQDYDWMVKAESIDLVCQGITTAKNVQRDVISIEYPTPVTYLGFQTIRELNGSMKILVRRLRRLNGYNSNVPVFVPKPHFEYVRVSEEILNSRIGPLLIAEADDVQNDCVFFDGQFDEIVSYLGYFPYSLSPSLLTTFQRLDMPLRSYDMNIDDYPNETEISPKWVV